MIGEVHVDRHCSNHDTTCYYFRTRLACLTKFSITPSKASLSPSALSFRVSQYSSTSLARAVNSSSVRMCARNSSSRKLESAASVVVQSIFVVPKSSSGGGGGPFRFRLDLCVDTWSSEAEDALSCRSRTRELLRRPSDGECEPRCRPVEGRMSFFCLEAGRISSRSTGTPNETKNRRRIRERTQFGGCKGGGATSCDHRERLRSVRKTEYFSGIEYGGASCWVVGNSSSR